jgi:nicotinamidase/pyrazinamidase
MRLSKEHKTKELWVIIDPQKDFINEKGAYAKKHIDITQITEAKEKINKLVKQFAKDRFVVIFSNYEKDQFEKGLSIGIPGTKGHRIDIDIDADTILISKKEHSCFSSDVFNEYLKDNAINKLILCGFLAEYCVKQTAIDGLAKGYEIVLVQDCIGTGDDVQYRKERMLIELKERGADVLTSIDL